MIKWLHKEQIQGIQQQPNKIRPAVAEINEIKTDTMIFHLPYICPSIFTNLMHVTIHTQINISVPPTCIVPTATYGLHRSN